MHFAPACALDTQLSLQPVTKNDVRQCVLSLHGGSALGCCQISTQFLKDNLNLFLIPLHFIVNSSITQGIFPEVFKMAKVIPLFKSGIKNYYSNYRTISLLSVFSKVLEKLVKKQLLQYLEVNNVLTCSQYGFRLGKNTADFFFYLNTD